MNEQEKMRLLIGYQQYLSIHDFDSLHAKERWYLEQLSQLNETYLPKNSGFILEQIEEFITDTRMELDEIKMYLDGIS